MGRAKSVSELLATKVETFPFKGEWYDAFGEPERKGVWLVWGIPVTENNLRRSAL